MHLAVVPARSTGIPSHSATYVSFWVCVRQIWTKGLFCTSPSVTGVTDTAAGRALGSIRRHDDGSTKVVCSISGKYLATRRQLQCDAGRKVKLSDQSER